MDWLPSLEWLPIGIDGLILAVAEQDPCVCIKAGKVLNPTDYPITIPTMQGFTTRVVQLGVLSNSIAQLWQLPREVDFLCKGIG
jgi:hypothetical protein